MMPNDSLGRLDRTAGFLWRQPSLSDPLTDYHPGGVALNNADEGLNVQLWTLTYEGEDVTVTPEQGGSIVLFSRPGITELSLAFDSLMAPFVAFTDAGGSTFWWFNPATSQHEFFPYLPAGTVNVRCRLDDNRELAQSYNDILVAYLRDRNLYHRRQRDNYSNEILLKEDAGSVLFGMGMNSALSMQFRLGE